MKIVCLYIAILISGLSFGQSLKKGYEALSIYNYFKAKQIFEKQEQKNPSPAAYGLAIIYLRRDNPFHNIDSAYVKILKTLAHYEAIKPKQKEKFKEFGLFDDSVYVVRQTISTQHFERTVTENSEEAFVAYIANHPWSVEIPAAIYKRDSLAFLIAEDISKSESYADFLTKYPESTFSSLAQELFYRMQYEEETHTGKEEAYHQFIINYSENPYKAEAERTLFELVTASHTVKNYTRFIRTYPSNPYVNEAWRLLYRAFNRDFSTSKLEEFKQTYPDYPFMEELIREQEALQKILLPFKHDDKWGYIDKFGTVAVKPEFDGASFFNEGIAIVQLKGKLGYIDALGNFIVKPQFSEAYKFVDGIALVADEDERYGVIDRTGVMILETIYEEIGTTSNGVFYVLEDEGYVYYNHSGKRIISQQFDQAESFENGRAIVVKDEVYQVIDLEGKVLFSSHERIRRFNAHFVIEDEDVLSIVNVHGDTLFVGEDVVLGSSDDELIPFVKDDYLGYLNREGKVVVEPIFEAYPNALIFAKFKNGHAKVMDEKSSKYGLIDTLGNWAIPPRYTDISFYSDLIAAKRTEFWEYIDVRQNRKWNRRFALAESFFGQTAVVMDENKYGLLNRQGEFVLPPQYSEIVNVHDKLLRVRDDKGFWLTDKLGKKKLPLAYQRIELIDNGILQLFRDNEMDYYLIEEDCIIEIQY